MHQTAVEASSGQRLFWESLFAPPGGNYLLGWVVVFFPPVGGYTYIGRGVVIGNYLGGGG